MDDCRIPKQLFYGQLKAGKRPFHKPRKRFKDNIKGYLKEMKIDEKTWENVAHIRSEWREVVKAGCKYFELNRVQRVCLKRALRKGSHLNVEANPSKYRSCGQCHRVLLSKAGYLSHMKSHNKVLPAYNLNDLPDDLRCAICDLKCKSHSGLKRHTAMHAIVQQGSSLKPMGPRSFVCHTCHEVCRSLAGLKSHRRAHERRLHEDRTGETRRDGTHL